MQLRLIKNTDMDATLSYRVARVVYEPTGAETLRVVEALTSMIKNQGKKKWLKSLIPSQFPR